MKKIGHAGILLWNEHLRKMRQIQKTALELLCHPDTTPEQLWLVHESMVRTMQLHRELSPKIEEAWPRMGRFVDL